MMEVLFAMVIFAIVSTATITVLTSATAADGLARQRSIALELAQQQVEYVRQLNYEDAGIQNGNPPGVVLASASKQVMGLWYTLSTRIRWVNDATPTSWTTDSNYKQVRVIVSRATDNKQLAKVTTYVSNASRTPLGGINNAIINVTVLDYYLKSPITGAQVDLWDGPDGHTSDVTDSSGIVTFPNLTPNPTSGANAWDDLLTSLGGYVTLEENTPFCTTNCPGVPAGTNAAPALAAHVQLSPSQTFNTTLYMYQPETIQVNLFQPGGVTPYTGTAYIDVGAADPRGAYEFTSSTTPAVTGGSLSIPSSSTILSERPVSGAAYTVSARTANGTSAQFASASTQTGPSGYPTNLVSIYNLTLSSALTTKACTITVKKGTTGVGAGARVDATDNSSAAVKPYETLVTNSSSQVVFYLPVVSGDSYTIGAWTPASGGMWGATYDGSASLTVPSGSTTCSLTVTVS